MKTETDGSRNAELELRTGTARRTQKQGGEKHLSVAGERGKLFLCRIWSWKIALWASESSAGNEICWPITHHRLAQRAVVMLTFAEFT